MAYREVKRADRWDKKKMQELIESLNEVSSIEEPETRYHMEKARTAYVIVATTDEEETGRGSFVKCAKCGEIREYFEGQVPGCWDCDATWEW